VVVSYDVVRVRDPHTSWSLVSVESTPRLLGHDNKVVLNYVVGFCSIFNENSVTHSVVHDVVSNGQMMHSMDSSSSVVRLPYGITLYIRFMYSSNHVEVNSIPSKFESLADIEELTMGNSSLTSFVSIRVDHDLASILVLFTILFVSLEFDISSKKSYLSSHVDEKIIIVLSVGKMFEVKLYVKSKHWVVWVGVIDCNDIPLLSMS